MCYNVFVACVAELVDAHDSKSCGFSRVGSIPTTSTRLIITRTYKSLSFLYNRKVILPIVEQKCGVYILHTTKKSGTKVPFLKTSK